MDVQQKLSEGASLIQSALQSVEESCAKKRAELDVLVEDVEKKTAELALLNGNIENSRIEQAKVVATYREAAEEAADKLKKLADEVMAAETELAAVKRKHKQFMDYQVKAEKALKSREQAILEREKTLEEIIGQAKRRTSILGGVV